MKVALLTGPSGSGKSFVLSRLNDRCDVREYDHLMRDAMRDAFPFFNGKDEWDKYIWRVTQTKIDHVKAFERAFTWNGERPLLVEGYQLRDDVWRRPILELAKSRIRDSLETQFFIIAPTVDLLITERSRSKGKYHRDNATVEHCTKEIECHEKAYVAEPWSGVSVRCTNKEEALERIAGFLLG